MSKLLVGFEALHITLLSFGDPQQAVRSKRLLKTSAKVLGISDDRISLLSRDFYHRYGHRYELTQVYPFLRRLWHSDIWEERMLTLRILNRYRKEFDRNLFGRLSRWLNEVEDTVLCDALGHQIALIVKAYPQQAVHIRKWTHSDNVWRRRTAAVSLFLPKPEDGKHLVLDLQSALEIVEPLIEDQNVLVQKGVAAFFKKAVKDEPAQTEEFLRKRQDRLPPIIKKAARRESGG